MTASPCPPPERDGWPGNEPDGRKDAGAVMPFHALFLALLTPPLAAFFLLLMFGARPLGAPLVLATLAPAYFIGFVPALLAGWLDVLLARHGWRVLARLATVAGMGIIAGLVILAPLHLEGRIHGVMPLLLPLALALSAILALGLALLMARLYARNRPV